MLYDKGRLVYSALIHTDIMCTNKLIRSLWRTLYPGAKKNHEFNHCITQRVIGSSMGWSTVVTHNVFKSLEHTRYYFCSCMPFGRLILRKRLKLYGYLCGWLAYRDCSLPIAYLKLLRIPVCSMLAMVVLCFILFLFEPSMSAIWSLLNSLWVNSSFLKLWCTVLNICRSFTCCSTHWPGFY